MRPAGARDWDHFFIGMALHEKSARCVVSAMKKCGVDKKKNSPWAGLTRPSRASHWLYAIGLRLHPCERTQRHAVHWRDFRSVETYGATSSRCRLCLCQKIQCQ